MISIRPIRETDAEQFREALDAVCRERKYLARSEAPPLESVQKFVTANVQAGHPQFVAEASGRIVGWCDALPDTQKFGRAHLAVLGMGVIRDYRGQKIGSRLIEAVIAATRLRPGVEKIELVAHASNTPALALYRKFGFETEGVKKRGLLVDGEYDDLVLMGLPLQRPREAEKTGETNAMNQSPRPASQDAPRIRLAISPPITGTDLHALLNDAGTLDPGVDLDAMLARALFYVGAFDGARLIGFAKVIDDGGVHGFLLDPTVCPALRRQGIGTALVTACIAETKRRGLEWLHVDFEPRLELFYRRCGFAPSLAGVMNLKANQSNTPP